MLVTNATLVTLGPAGVVEKGAVLVRQGRIAEVGTAALLEARHPHEETLDAEGNVCSPGLVNAHMHLYSTFARGMEVPGAAPRNFVEVLERLWWRLDRALEMEDLYPSAAVPLCDGLRAGVTTVVDHHAGPGAIDGSLDEIARACRDVGVRGVLCYEVSDRDGAAVARAGLRENVRFVREVKGDPLLRGMIGLHASFTLSDATLERAGAEARALGVGAHIHAAEDRADEEDAIRRSGVRVAQRLDRHGLLGEGAILAHGVHLDDAEAAILAERGAALVHNPQSNANNAVGWGRLPQRLAAGIRVGLGTDGMTSAILDEARMALLMARHELGDPAAAWEAVGRVLFEGNRAIAERCFGAPLGVLAPGALADLVVWNYQPPTPLAAENFLGHALFGLTQANARDAVVAGVLRMREGVVLRVDEAEVRARARERAASLWQRLAS
jgi:putative selenium metabolism protein SsnA